MHDFETFFNNFEQYLKKIDKSLEKEFSSLFDQYKSNIKVEIKDDLVIITKDGKTYQISFKELETKYKKPEVTKPVFKADSDVLDFFRKPFGNEWLKELHDSKISELVHQKIKSKLDAFVVEMQNHGIMGLGHKDIGGLLHRIGDQIKSYYLGELEKVYQELHKNDK